LNVAPYEKWDGKSYAGLINGEEVAGWNSLVLSQQAHVNQRAARFDDYIYIRTISDGFHLFDDEMLFNIKDDPHEQYDIKDKHPEICAAGAKIILDWHDEMMAKSAQPDSPLICAIDPLWTVLQEGGPYHTVGALDGYIKRLRETGRSGGADKLAQKYKK